MREAKSYYIQTWGCQMNERDSEIIAAMLENDGLSSVSDVKAADVIVLNTCCIRDKAEQKVYARIGELVRLKKEKPSLIIAVSGCVPQQQGVEEHIRKRFPQVDLVLGTHNLYRFPELLRQVGATNGTFVEIWDEFKPEQAAFEDRGLKRKEYLKAKVNISHGCNNYCSYCIVPYVRGRERSRDPEDILREIKHLEENGCVEVLLLGQNVNSYGKDLKEDTDFTSLLRRICSIDGIKRIRFMTSHPKDLSERLIAAIACHEKICSHVHLPVQAGSNRVLKMMNRSYSREEYLSLVEKLRENINEVSITTDLIVGFPGETGEDFSETLDLVKKLRFDSAYMFVFSPRKGTGAAAMEDPVPREIKKERLAELMQVQKEISLENNLQYVGKKYEILVDGKEKENGGGISYVGRTSTNKVVVLDKWHGRDLYGTFNTVEIVEAQSWSLKGRTIERKP